MTSADELRAAATKLRTLAEGATPGPWTRDYNYLTAEVPSGRPGGEVIGQMTPSVVSLGTPDKANAAYVATMHPGVALALAKWLDAAATAWGRMPEPVDDCPPLDVARAINGGTP